MGLDFTPQQRAAIDHRGSSVLVSAAAGSGKTRVLTERLMSYVTDCDDPRDIDTFLIITYTRAAAAELRGRILTNLSELAAQNPTDRRIQRQQGLCYRAQIGTIHSFCSDVIKENAQALAISPDFHVMDEERAAATKQTVMSRVMDEHYEHMDEEFTLLVDTVGAGRDDSRLVNIILNIYEKLQSHPYPERWAAECAEKMRMEGIADAAQTVWGQELLKELRSSADYWTGRMEEAVSLLHGAGGKIEKAYGETVAESADALRDFRRALDMGWDKAREFADIPFTRPGYLRNPDDPQLLEKVKGIREKCKKKTGDWQKTLSASSEELVRDMRTMAPAMKALLDLAVEFGREFAAEKRRQSQLDFSDLEHMALKILVDENTGKPTDIARELSRRYTEIMVDEYQDVNRVQDMIFRAVSKDGNNLFMVGDVKQSIYRFRLADPTIFIETQERYAAGEGGQCILLQKNFRSRSSVIDACNSIFSSIFSRKLGDVEYDESAALVFGASDYTADTNTKAELVLIEPADKSDEETPAKTEQEALYIARRIKKMMAEGTPVYDRGVPRPCRWGDFALLLHSPGVSGGDFQRVFDREGVPVQSQQGGGFFASPEVQDVINMLSVVDNPHADVPLIAVLRSPAFGFTADELAMIRAQDKKACFYDCLKMRAEGGDSRCSQFIDRLTAIRIASRDMSLESILLRIYSETQLLSLCVCGDGGQARHDDLMRFFDYVRKFLDSGGSGLGRFVTWLRRMQERGSEPAASAGGDCVKIMSIHKSKGLEFPVVFLADMSHGFNIRDTAEPVLMHQDLGLGPKLTDVGRGVEYPTLARRAIERRMRREAASEEMRVLYVALTRAKEKLIMTAIFPKAQESLDSCSTLGSPIDPELLQNERCFAKWLAAAAAVDGGRTVDITIEMSENSSSETIENEKEVNIINETNFDEVSRRLSFVYPHEVAASAPSKLTATGIKGRMDDELLQSESENVVKAPVERTFRRPDFGSTKLNAAQRGTATHTVMEHVEFSKLSDRDGVEDELMRLTAAGRISDEEKQAVDRRMLLNFGHSELCRRILAAQEVKREFRFTLLVGSEDGLPVPEGDRALLQGVVDCYIVENGEITVIDYKTDRISREEMAERTQHYAPQLRAYAMALRRITGLPVREAVLFYLRLGESAAVNV